MTIGKNRRSGSDLGKRGEELAADFCREKGFIIIEQNYRIPAGEIDIIAKDREQLVFIEVKSRAGDVYGKPFEAVTRNKQERIKKAALDFMKRRFKGELSARFDVISISVKNGRSSIDYIQDAFEV